METSMPLALDHIFILTEPGAPAADNFLELGFVEGNTNVHPGQGTSNRRFFLSDFFIEFVYVSNADEAANGAGKALGILARSEDLEASPFGVIVRVSDSEEVPDFPSWQYTPDYFDGNMSFYVGNNSNLLPEPLCICMPPALPKRSAIPPEHQNPEWKLSGLEIVVPVETPSAVLQQFAAIDRVNVEYGKSHLMTLKFNNGDSMKVIDLSPELPLMIEY